MCGEVIRTRGEKLTGVNASNFIKLGGDTALFKTTELLKRWRSSH
jgi:hypothetical protein